MAPMMPAGLILYADVTGRGNKLQHSDILPCSQYEAEQRTGVHRASVKALQMVALLRLVSRVRCSQ